MSPRRLRVAVLLTLSAPALAHAVGPEPPPTPPGGKRYTVRRGENCLGIVRRAYGDGRFLEFYHAANPQLGPQPHRLLAGTVVILPARPADPPAGPDARLTWLRNRVEAFTPERHPGEKNEPLMRGHRVSTLDASSAEVTFLDESRMQLGEHTLVVILGESGGAARKTAADTTLLSGALRAHLSELAGGTPRPLPLATPGTRTVLEGGESQLSVDDKRTTRLAVYRGRGRLAARGREVAVKADYGSRVDENKPPTPPRPLPAPPAWTVRPAGLLVMLEAPPTLRGEYGAGARPETVPASQEIPPPAGWHVQLGRDERFNDLVFDARLPVDKNALEVQGLGEGEYLARVSAVDADAFEGRFGEVARVRVVRGQLLPPAPPDTQGRLLLPDGIFCGLDGASLAEVRGPLTLLPGPRHTLRCAPEASGAGSSELALELPSLPPPPPVEAPLAAPRLIPVPASPPRVTAEGALLGVLHIDDGFRRANLGLGVAGELGLAVRLGPGALAAAVRGGYDQYDDTPNHHVARVALPLAYRFRHPENTWVPYVGALPELLWETTQARGTRSFKLGLGGLVGLSWNRGPHAIALELGYGHRFGQEPERGDLPADNFSLALGYRFTLRP